MLSGLPAGTTSDRISQVDLSREMGYSDVVYRSAIVRTMAGTRSEGPGAESWSIRLTRRNALLSPSLSGILAKGGTFATSSSVVQAPTEALGDGI